MSLTEEDEHMIDQALKVWRQGDVTMDEGLEFFHVADHSRPHSCASIQVADALAKDGEAMSVADKVPGLVMLSQTCDIVRGCHNRPFVEVAPLIEVCGQWVEEIRRLRRPAFAYIATIADKRLVADLDRTMTVEKALVSEWTRTPGWQTDEELGDFIRTLVRKRSRFAFPDDFVAATQKLQKHLQKCHNRQSDECAHLRALREIRVRAAPSWDDRMIQLSWWFIKDVDPVGVQVNWSTFLDSWFSLFDQTGRFYINQTIACRLEDMTALDYVESDQVDLDRLSAV